MAAPNPEFNAVGKQQAVRAMFAEIAPTYDRLNHLLSINIDRQWRRVAVRHLAEILQRPAPVVLDLCCGTGDLTAELAQTAPQAQIIGCDFCHPMLVAGAPKLASRTNALLIEGDALHLPFADHSFDAVTIAFGLRNLEDVRAGLQEIRRVLKPGGRAAILEFSHPVIPLFRTLFNFYFNHILPTVGAWISGSRGAYTYLPLSVRHFPDQQTLAGMMREAGFSEVRHKNLAVGVAALHLGESPFSASGEEI